MLWIQTSNRRPELVPHSSCNFLAKVKKGLLKTDWEWDVGEDKGMVTGDNRLLDKIDPQPRILRYRVTNQPNPVRGSDPNKCNGGGTEVSHWQSTSGVAFH
jgi:hypothetical protein